MKKMTLEEALLELKRRDRTITSLEDRLDKAEREIVRLISEKRKQES